ncbi:type II toxin-antitoxin system HicA family toxin [Taurinivorans muris]|uniref:Type II toxin-antitoxin system HicA family toxin n=1 Tax=Taurinivorans muris TaxID=2787751 RepID=A0ABY5Y4V4_9BACT|nr:type II toxin-antitoxin system HicA family toxin [Desulfovibrionaceae bacterium LT0009]
MKRKDILQKLAEAGLIFKEGGNHTKVYSKEGKFLSVISRQNEINELRVRDIEKQTGVKLK